MFEKETIELSKPILEEIEGLTAHLEKLRITKADISKCLLEQGALLDRLEEKIKESREDKSQD
jgi:hypothetical protein